VSKHRPRKRFGQHFLIDPGVINAIVDSVSPDENDVIVEIGPGPGAITVPIAKYCGHLHAIELDRDLAARLRTQFAGSERVSIHEADALTFDYSTLGPKLRIIGNLPYNISTPLLFHLLEQRHLISDMHFMLQKEVVDRMAAEPGSKAFGRLTIMLGCYLDIDGLFDVDRSSFDPPPAVTSAVVRLCPKPAGDIHIKDGRFLSSLVAAAFSKRRKTLRNALKSYATEDELAGLGIDAGLRPENIAISDWVALANHLGEKADRQ
jgi:16S rRNA (adenine1518-N6/adenine1519-N6)-dimethyltransferase